MASRMLKEGEESGKPYSRLEQCSDNRSYAELIFTFLKKNYLQDCYSEISNLHMVTNSPR